MESKELEQAPPIAYYLINGTNWRQEQGTYEEDCKTNEIVERMQSEVKITNIVFGIDQFLANPLLPELFKVILKQHTPSLWNKIKQRFFAWKNNVDLQKPILCMQKWQRRKVLQDFFVLNISSMMSSMSSEFISTLISLNSKSPMEIQSNGKSQSSTQPMETMQTRKQ
jgi:hypothetical protein